MVSRTIKKFIIYTKDDCSFCKNAKLFLRNLNYDFEEISIGTEISKQAFLDMFKKDFSVIPRTVPQIVLIDDFGKTYIGGYDNLQKYFQ